ncbi:hypothetical protein [Phytopseudomonas seleniipraecipitans]|uniref:Uncharacterized protein n=1 Tax=Phytopseudomonas seleniipraecipitans TaxID=640205 RepID=A0A1G7NM62_9GAMM|nr:hypothetical protein [Pseudomonas seleniipraecipitans]SDF75148.1 hypothetical protein SAMN05216381_2349 [Pseudomonas seleniipraecipitans]
MSVVAVQVCMEWVSSDSSMTCTQLGWQQAYLIPPEAAGYVDILVAGGFSPEAFAVGFGGTLLVFAIGLSGGMVASILRRMR